MAIVINENVGGFVIQWFKFWIIRKIISWNIRPREWAQYVSHGKVTLRFDIINKLCGQQKWCFLWNQQFISFCVKLSQQKISSFFENSQKWHGQFNLICRCCGGGTVTLSICYIYTSHRQRMLKNPKNTLFLIKSNMPKSVVLVNFSEFFACHFPPLHKH